MQIVGAIAKCLECSLLDRGFVGRGELPLIFGKFAANGAGGKGGWGASGLKNHDATDAHCKKIKKTVLQDLRMTNTKSN